MKRLWTGLCVALWALGAQAASVNLAWTGSANATGYKLHVGTASGSYTQHIDVGAATVATVPGLADGTKYYFAATAYNTVGESGYSNEVTTTTAAAGSTVPLVPADFFAADIAGGEKLTWTLSAGATKYNVYKSTTSGQQGALLGSVTAPPAIDCSMTAGTRYYWQITAVNAAGESAPSTQDYGAALAGTCSGDSFGQVTTPPGGPPLPTGIMPAGALQLVATVGGVDSASLKVDGSAAIPCTVAAGVASCPIQSRFFDTAAKHTYTITSTLAGAMASASASFTLSTMGCSTAAGLKNGVDVYTQGCKRSWTRN